VDLDWSLDLVELRLWRDKNQIFTILDLIFNLLVERPVGPEAFHSSFDDD